MALFRSLIRIFSGQTTLEGLACLYNDESIGMENSFTGNDFTRPEHLIALKAIQFTNKYIAKNHGDLAMFATLFFGVLDPQTGILTYINAGHDPLLIVNECGGIKEQLNPTGPSVGIDSESKFDIEEIQLEVGEILIGYTDGVIEARSAEDKFFSLEQLLRLFTEPAVSAAELLERVSEEVKSHTGDADQYDDITLLAIRRMPE